MVHTILCKKRKVTLNIKNTQNVFCDTMNNLVLKKKMCLIWPSQKRLTTITKVAQYCYIRLQHLQEKTTPVTSTASCLISAQIVRNYVVIFCHVHIRHPLYWHDSWGYDMIHHNHSHSIAAIDFFNYITACCGNDIQLWLSMGNCKLRWRA